VSRSAPIVDSTVSIAAIRPEARSSCVRRRYSASFSSSSAYAAG
jgi:hypothetical protein